MLLKNLNKMKKLLPLLTLAVMVWTLKQLVDSKEEFGVRTLQGHHNIEPAHKPAHTLFDDVGMPRDGDSWCDKTPSPCERGAGSCTPCSGAPEGMCIDNGCGAGGGWQNTVSRDCTGEWAPNKPDGSWRTFQKPNYYGWGTCGGGHSYGEPYYSRAVKY